MKSKINPNPKYQIPKPLLVIWILSFVILTSGCEAFVRKFTRKPKKENLPHEEMVLEPQEYKVVMPPKEEQYRQYFLYWRSWHDELINALSVGGSHKKQTGCASEAVKNLHNLRPLLNETLQKKLDIYISRLKDISESIEKDIYGSDLASNRLDLERLKRNILRDFSYNKVKAH